MLASRKTKPEMSLSKLTVLNDMLVGLQRKKLYVIAARPSHGKSAMALSIAYDLALQGHEILFLSLEMDSESIVERLFCMEYGINNKDLLRGKFGELAGKWQEFTNTLSNLNFVLSDMLGKNCHEIERFVTNLTKKPKIVFIDHLNEISSGNQRNKNEVIDAYLENLRVMALRENFSVAICTQVHRLDQNAKEETRPTLQDLKGSGGIEEKADVVMLLYWPWHGKRNREKIDKNKFEIHVAKNRGGETGYMTVNYIPHCYRFENREESQDDVEKLNEIVGAKPWAKT